MASSEPSVLLAVVGVRPQYIRLKALRYLASLVELPEIVSLDTRQHRSLSLRYEAEPSPKISLDAPNDIFETSRSIVDHVRTMDRRPHAVLAMGDANPAAIAALVGLGLGIPIVHIEAGARRLISEAEDRNIRLADSVAALSCASSRSSLSSLQREGYASRSILTGDLAYPFFERQYGMQDRTAKLERTRLLITLHRPFNSNAATIESLADTIISSDMEATWITHPRNDAIVRRSCKSSGKIAIRGPVSHSEMVEQIRRSRAVITDSGGLIRECHYLKRNVGVLRPVGGWSELIDRGVNVRIAQENEVSSAIPKLLDLSMASYPQGNLFQVAGGPQAFAANVKRVMGGD